MGCKDSQFRDQASSPTVASLGVFGPSPLKASNSDLASSLNSGSWSHFGDLCRRALLLRVPFGALLFQGFS